MSAGAVSLAEVLAAAAHGRAPVAPETAGYFALGLADLLVEVPVRIDEASCGLTDEGTVVLAETARTPTTAVEAEGAVRRVLQRLLDVASGGATASLVLAGDRAASAGVAALVREIEAALIPVNRSAARRALARLARETLRARQDGVLDAPAAVAPPSRDRARGEAPSEARVSVRTEIAPPVIHDEAGATPEPAPLAPAEPPRTRSRADELLSRFIASESRTEGELARDLKRMAGLDPTPAPPAAARPAPAGAPVHTPSPSGQAEVAEQADASVAPPTASPAVPPVTSAPPPAADEAEPSAPPAPTDGPPPPPEPPPPSEVAVTPSEPVPSPAAPRADFADLEPEIDFSPPKRSPLGAVLVALVLLVAAAIAWRVAGHGLLPPGR